MAKKINPNFLEVITINNKNYKEEEAANEREEQLLKMVGQLSMENNWLKKKLEILKL